MNNRNHYQRKDKACAVCGETFSPAGQNSKYCDVCRAEVQRAKVRIASYRHAVETGRIKKPGIGSGNDNGHDEQARTYKNGIGIYRRTAYKAHGYNCLRCGVDLRTLRPRQGCVHHLNENRKDNHPENLAVMCRKCHFKEHNMGEVLALARKG